tara:strand:- start:365 stop:748 length:384 start_codon:yes stop_codon:yes gene_type:complete
MSAFIVSQNHINYLVQAARHISRDMSRRYPNGSDVALMLETENWKSVTCRYGHEKDFGETPTLRNVPFQPKVRLTPVQVLKAIACYEYQSCEHLGWETSTARQFCERLRAAMIRDLPGYEEATWEIA